MKSLLRIPGYLLAILRALVAFPSILLFLLVYAITTPIYGHTPDRSFKLRRSWIKFGVKLFGIKLNNIGGPIDKPALYVSNHLSFTDPIATCLHLDAYVIAKAEVASIPILSRGAELTGIIYVKRDSKASRSNTRKALVETLTGGQNVLVYPEGTVSQDEIVLPYKAGAFREAIAHGIPIVPIAISYRDRKDIWSNTSLVTHFFKQLSYWNTVITQEFGEPLVGNDGKVVAELAYAWTMQKLLHWKEKS